MCEWIQTLGKTNHELKASIFTCLLMLKKSGFFNVKLILFMNNFYKHIFRSSRLQMFFKISALKNFTLLRIKKRLQHRYFRVRSCHMMLIYWYFFHRTLITSHFRYVNIVKFLRTVSLWNTSRSSRLQMLFKIDALKSFGNFTGKHLSWNLFLKNLQAKGLQLY